MIQRNLCTILDPAQLTRQNGQARLPSQHTARLKVYKYFDIKNKAQQGILTKALQHCQKTQKKQNPTYDMNKSLLLSDEHAVGRCKSRKILFRQMIRQTIQKHDQGESKKPDK